MHTCKRFNWFFLRMIPRFRHQISAEQCTCARCIWLSCQLQLLFVNNWIIDECIIGFAPQLKRIYAHMQDSIVCCMPNATISHHEWNYWWMCHRFRTQIRADQCTCARFNCFSCQMHVCSITHGISKAESSLQFCCQYLHVVSWLIIICKLSMRNRPRPPS